MAFTSPKLTASRHFYISSEVTPLSPPSYSLRTAISSAPHLSDPINGHRPFYTPAPTMICTSSVVYILSNLIPLAKTLHHYHGRNLGGVNISDFDYIQLYWQKLIAYLWLITPKFLRQLCASAKPFEVRKPEYTATPTTAPAAAASYSPAGVVSSCSSSYSSSAVIQSLAVVALPFAIGYLLRYNNN
ncbi:hypothetical protein D9757_012355 [Collybiopsis confluens]|uniref:Uncharacterized protein n=1 Tax=Collybiopsis confluens TaxID=2823264 RepID=A0A8H5G360_9AGAR|nr:hypothetical protein D9757_012355 [Collybiopsis confluens]